MEEFERRFKVALASLREPESADADELPEDDTEGVTVESETSEASSIKPTAQVIASPLPPLTLKNLFQHPDAHPYVLDLALLQKYGPEWLEWESETLELVIPRDFPTPGLSEVNLSKLQAVRTLHAVDSFWESWEVFVPVTVSLNAVLPDFEVMQVPTAAQCAVAVGIALLIRGEVVWSEELKTYLSVLLEHEGVFCPIPPLDFVEVDSEEYGVDCAAIKQRWPFVKLAKKAPTGDTVEEEQLRRLLLIQDALDDARDRLTYQLPLLRHD